MKEKAKRIYDEISKLFQDGDCIVLDMLDNLYDILMAVDDDFLEQFSYDANTELCIDEEEEEEDENDSDRIYYETPAVTFSLIKDRRIYFEIECGGVMCVNPNHPAFGEDGSKYPPCFIPSSVVRFSFDPTGSNRKVAAEFVDYFTKHFVSPNSKNVLSADQHYMKSQHNI